MWLVDNVAGAGINQRNDVQRPKHYQGANVRRSIVNNTVAMTTALDEDQWFSDNVAPYQRPSSWEASQEQIHTVVSTSSPSEYRYTPPVIPGPVPVSEPSSSSHSQQEQLQVQQQSSVTPQQTPTPDPLLNANPFTESDSLAEGGEGFFPPSSSLESSFSKRSSSTPATSKEQTPGDMLSQLESAYPGILTLADSLLPTTSGVSSTPLSEEKRSSSSEKKGSSPAPIVVATRTKTVFPHASSKATSHAESQAPVVSTKSAVRTTIKVPTSSPAPVSAPLPESSVSSESRSDSSTTESTSSSESSVPSESSSKSPPPAGVSPWTSAWSSSWTIPIQSSNQADKSSQSVNGLVRTTVKHTFSGPKSTDDIIQTVISVPSSSNAVSTSSRKFVSSASTASTPTVAIPIPSDTSSGNGVEASVPLSWHPPTATPTRSDILTFVSQPRSSLASSVSTTVSSVPVASSSVSSSSYQVIQPVETPSYTLVVPSYMRTSTSTMSLAPSSVPGVVVSSLASLPPPTSTPDATDLLPVSYTASSSGYLVPIPTSSHPATIIQSSELPTLSHSSHGSSSLPVIIAPLASSSSSSLSQPISSSVATQTTMQSPSVVISESQSPPTTTPSPVETALTQAPVPVPPSSTESVPASTTDWLPGALITAGSPTPTSDEPAGNQNSQKGSPSTVEPGSSSHSPTVPVGLPQYISPTGTPGRTPKGYKRVQIGFEQQLNYPFVVTNPLAAAQIFSYLPKGLGHGLEAPVKQMRMVQLQPYSMAEVDYVITLAILDIPEALVSTLNAQMHSPMSQLYQFPNNAGVKSLMNLIDSSIPLVAKGNGAVNSGGQVFGQPSSSDGNSGSDGSQGQDGGSNSGNGNNGSGNNGNEGSITDNGSLDSNGPQSSSSAKVEGKTVGITVGTVCGAAAYFGVAFLVMRRYRIKKKQQLTLGAETLAAGAGGRGSGMGGGPVMTTNGLEAGAIAAAAAGRGSPMVQQHYYDDASSFDSSASSGRRHPGISTMFPVGQARISEPVLSQNSLGWA